MEYKTFKNILNNKIFETSKKDLLEKIAEYPERYIGLFRPTKPKAKILQNLLQSNEIRFGEALEFLFKKYFEEIGFENLNNKMKSREQELDLDQFFKDEKFIYFMEQKIRDDHDSTKKRGQMENFEKKISAILKIHKETELRCFMYFIDPSLVKNKKYYSEEIEKLKNDYNVSIELCYGSEFWNSIGHTEIWKELLNYLEKWKTALPEMPSINFDENPLNSFEEIKNIDIPIFRKLFNNREICEKILPILFPQSKVLKLLHSYFDQFANQSSINKNLSVRIQEFMQRN